jgi:predicted secreted protein
LNIRKLSLINKTTPVVGVITNNHIEEYSKLKLFNIMKTLLLLSSFCLVIFISHTLFAQTVYSSNDTNITINSGDLFTISLESNPSTGYSWSVAENQDNAQVVVLGMEYKQTPTDGKVIGSGGLENWRFKSLSTGSIKLVFYYSRSWEKVQPAKTLMFNVTVK